MERAFHLMVKGIHARAYFFPVKDEPLLPHDHSLLNNLATNKQSLPLSVTCLSMDVGNVFGSMYILFYFVFVLDLL